MSSDVTLDDSIEQRLFLVLMTSVSSTVVWMTAAVSSSVTEQESVLSSTVTEDFDDSGEQHIFLVLIVSKEHCDLDDSSGGQHCD